MNGVMLARFRGTGGPGLRHQTTILGSTELADLAQAGPRSLPQRQEWNPLGWLEELLEEVLERLEILGGFAGAVREHQRPWGYVLETLEGEIDSAYMAAGRYRRDRGASANPWTAAVGGEED